MENVAPENRHGAPSVGPSLYHKTKSVAKADLQRFYAAHWDGESPLLLGYSGGPDSKALLYASLECDIPLHVAHVDHGWREESRGEAEILREEIERLGLPFYTVRLPLMGRANAEEKAREARFAFFQELFAKVPFQALLLAHHRGDQAETALKRLFEGAHLSALGAMRPVSQREGIEIWRPWLHRSKKQIALDLEERQQSAFCDRTNFDPAYLRARMRSELLPSLERSFGKGIEENLALLGERAQELSDYVERRIAPFLERVEKRALGFAVREWPAERFERRALVQAVLRREGLTLPRGPLEALLDWLAQKGRSRSLICGPWRLIVRKGTLESMACSGEETI